MKIEKIILFISFIITVVIWYFIIKGGIYLYNIVTE